MTSQARCKQKTWPPAVRRRPHTITITTLYTTLLSLSLFELFLFFFLVILNSFIISKAIVSSPPPPIFLSPSSSSVHLLLLLPPSSLYPLLLCHPTQNTLILTFRVFLSSHNIITNIIYYDTIFLPPMTIIVDGTGKQAAKLNICICMRLLVGSGGNNVKSL